MHTEALLSTSLLRRACVLGILLSVAILASIAEALPEPKVTITYSLKTSDGGAYWQKIFGTPLMLGDVEFVFDTAASLDPKVGVTRATPLVVTIEYTANMEGEIIDGAVELTQTDFGRDFVITTSFLGEEAIVTTLIDTVLSQKGTGTLSGSASPPATITWDNLVAPYKETVVGSSSCEEALCSLSPPEGGWPQNLNATDRAVVLPDFTVSMR